MTTMLTTSMRPVALCLTMTCMVTCQMQGLNITLQGLGSSVVSNASLEGTIAGNTSVPLQGLGSSVVRNASEEGTAAGNTSDTNITLKLPLGNSSVDVDMTTSSINSTVEEVSEEQEDPMTLGGANNSADWALVMSWGVNCSVEGSPCRMRMLDVTLMCANETGASEEDVDIAMRMEIPSSEEGKCLTKCLLKSRGMMTPEGLFSIDGTVDSLTQAFDNESLRVEFQKLADYCFNKLKVQPMSNLDSCQFAYDIAICTEEYHKTLFMRNPAMSPPVNAITTP